MAVASLALAVSCSSKSGSSNSPGQHGNDAPNEISLFGGFDRERVQGVDVLHNGNIVVAGETTSDFLALPAFRQTLAPPFDSTFNSTAPNSDGYVAILDPGMTHVLYWTYLGGGGADRAYFAREDDLGNIWVCGFTGSHAGMADPFPTGVESHCYKPNGCGGVDQNDWDVFVVKLRFDLSGPLLATTIIGGHSPENPRGTLTVDSGFVYVSGGTQSIDFQVSPGMPAVRPNTGSDLSGCSGSAPRHDAFVAQLSAADGSMIWCRALGGDGDDSAWAGVRGDKTTGDVFIGGNTSSTSFALDEAGIDLGVNIYRYDSFQPGVVAGVSDGYIARLSSTGSVKAVGYLGGSGRDWLAVNDGLELDAQGRPVVSGMTRSADLPTTPGALSNRHSNLLPGDVPCSQTAHLLDDCDADSTDVFVAKLSNDLSSAVFISYINAAAHGCPSTFFSEEPSGLALQGDAMLVSGQTDSPQFPVTPNGFDTVISAGVTPPGSPAHDAFLVRLGPDDQGIWQLQYGTFLGGNLPSVNADEPGNRARCLTVYPFGSRTGMALLSGQTTSMDFGNYTTHGVVLPDWLTGDQRDGFIAFLSTGQ